MSPFAELRAEAVAPRRPRRVWSPKPERLRLEDFEFAHDPSKSERFKNGKLRPTPRAQRLEDARRYVARLRAQYTVTKNPLYAFTAYEEAARVGMKIPDWVNGYLDLAWRNLMFLQYSRRPRRNIANAIAAAFGFVAGGVLVTNMKNSFEGGRLPPIGAWQKAPYNLKKAGAFNPFNKDRRFALATAVGRHLLAGSSPLYAYEHAAAEHRVHRRTAERAWAAYRAQFPILTDDTK